MLSAFLIGGFIILILFLFFYLKSHYKRVEHFKHGIHRRTAFPPREEEAKDTSRTQGYHKGLYYQFFKPISSESISMIIVMFHGYSDHCDFSMIEQAKELARRVPDACVLIFDQPGCGRSDGIWMSIDCWFAHARECIEFISSFLKVVHELSSEKEVPLIGYGFSMGGGLLATIDVLKPGFFAGLILIAPMIKIRPEMMPGKIKELIFRVAAKFVPNAPLLTEFRGPQQSYRSLEFQQNVTKLNFLGYHDNPRIGTAFQLYRAQLWLDKNIQHVTSRFIIFHGDCDEITCLKGSQQLFERAKSESKELRILKGYYHHIVGPGQDSCYSEAVYDSMVDWLLNL
jgi:alpha-beta hydrolase superfamily lysophospholipase